MFLNHVETLPFNRAVEAVYTLIYVLIHTSLIREVGHLKIC